MQPAGSDQEAPTRSASRRALIVEDSDAIRALLRQMLEGDSIEVIEASNGNQALELLRSDAAVGLVFLDMNMPGLSGLETLRCIRSEPAWAELPVIVLTGGAADAALAAKELGAAGWLQKPMRSEAIIRVARNFLGAS
jgi:CheY-like chemotaxis protein